MSGRLTVFSFSLMVACLYACLDEIEFQPPSEFQNSVVIQGKIVKGNPSSVELSVQNVFDFSFSDASFINAREVTVFNDKGHQLNVPATKTGFFKLEIDPSSGFEVNFDNSYGIEVSLLDGRSFRSELESMVPVPQLESINHQLVVKEEQNDVGITTPVPWVQYRVSTPLIGAENQLGDAFRWIIKGTYKQSDLIAKDQCYVTTFENPDRILLKNPSDSTNKFIDNELVLEQVVSRTMVEGQYITVIQESLDSRALNYWFQIRELSTNSGTFYEPPPGKLITNFNKVTDSESEVFGFFYATEHDSVHAFVDSTFIDYYTPICPHPDNVERENNDFGPCDDCCFCLWLANSTTEKPNFWVD